MHRYSLAFLNIGPVESNTSYVHGCSFNDGFNTALGVYGTDNLSIKNNVIHHGVNQLVEMEGANHTLVNNLIVLSLAEGTYKVSDYCGSYFIFSVIFSQSNLTNSSIGNLTRNNS